MGIRRKRSPGRIGEEGDRASGDGRGERRQWRRETESGKAAEVGHEREIERLVAGLLVKPRFF